jgi:hypothetical protein
MRFPRRHHNATLLPDGTVLVTGGTRGGGPPDLGFNDLAAGQPVHIAELWDPKGDGGKGSWTDLTAEERDRCYHATAVLLPDARVLSAGGGEYRPGGRENPPADSHRDAQIFSPPYLFKGARPSISAAPDAVTYGQTFDVETPQANDIATVSWIRLPSVTHAFDQSQRINVLAFKAQAGTLRVTAPSTPNMCPPGHYMLFILNSVGAPSIARIVQIQAVSAPAATAAETPETASRLPGAESSEDRAAYVDNLSLQADVVNAARGTAVVIGITGSCPYGIGACWGGAYEALHHLDGVDLVSPVPNTADSTADVFLKDERLPALDQWAGQLRRMVGGTYELRGVEVTLEGPIQARNNRLVMLGSGQRPPVELVPLTEADKIQWDQPSRALKPLETDEALAYERLAAASTGSARRRRLTVTGPLTMTDSGYRLHVRVLGR